MLEIGLCLVSLASVIASIETRHWFAAPFAFLFMAGYGYVAWLVGSEQLGQRLTPRADSGTSRVSAPGMDDAEAGVIRAAYRAARTGRRAGRDFDSLHLELRRPRRRRFRAEAPCLNGAPGFARLGRMRPTRRLPMWVNRARRVDFSGFVGHHWK